MVILHMLLTALLRGSSVCQVQCKKMMEVKNEREIAMLAEDIENSCSPEREWMLLSDGKLGGIAIGATSLCRC